MFLYLNISGILDWSLIRFIIIVIDLMRSAPATGGLNIWFIIQSGSLHFPFLRELRTWKTSVSVHWGDLSYAVISSLFSSNFCCNSNKSALSSFFGLSLSLWQKVSRYNCLILLGSVTILPLMSVLAAGIDCEFLGNSFFFRFHTPWAKFSPSDWSSSWKFLNSLSQFSLLTILVRSSMTSSSSSLSSKLSGDLLICGISSVLLLFIYLQILCLLWIM